MKKRCAAITICALLVCTAIIFSGCFGSKGAMPFSSKEVLIVRISKIANTELVNTKIIQDKSVWLPFFDGIDQLDFGKALINPGSVFAGSDFALTFTSGEKFVTVAIKLFNDYKQTYTAKIYKNATSRYYTIGVTPILKDIVDYYSAA